MGKAVQKLKSDGRITRKSPTLGCGGNEIAIDIHFDSGEIMTKRSSRGEIGIFGLLIRKVNARNKDGVYLVGIPISRPIGKSRMVETSSYAGALKAAFYCFDTARSLKSSLSDLL